MITGVHGAGRAHLLPGTEKYNMAFKRRCLGNSESAPREDVCFVGCCLRPNNHLPCGRRLTITKDIAS
jgi:hypothetical protein